jgi:hypothetical protein
MSGRRRRKQAYNSNNTFLPQQEAPPPLGSTQSQYPPHHRCNNNDADTHPPAPAHTHTHTKHHNFPFATKQTLASVDTYLVDHSPTRGGRVFQLGLELNNRRFLFELMFWTEKLEPVVISFFSTQIKKSWVISLLFIYLLLGLRVAMH